MSVSRLDSTVLSALNQIDDLSGYVAVGTGPVYYELLYTYGIGYGPQAVSAD
jgi:hypothetical protein